MKSYPLRKARQSNTTRYTVIRGANSLPHENITNDYKSINHHRTPAISVGVDLDTKFYMKTPLSEEDKKYYDMLVASGRMEDMFEYGVLIGRGIALKKAIDILRS